MWLADEINLNGVITTTYLSTKKQINCGLYQSPEGPVMYHVELELL